MKESSQALPVQMDVPVEEAEGELPVRYERDLVQKLKVLRHELSLQQPQAGHCRIEVSREEIFEVDMSFTVKIWRVRVFWWFEHHSCFHTHYYEPKFIQSPPQTFGLTKYNNMVETVNVPFGAHCACV